MEVVRQPRVGPDQVAERDDRREPVAELVGQVARRAGGLVGRRVGLVVLHAGILATGFRRPRSRAWRCALSWPLTEEERLLQGTAREFATREVAPSAGERDEAERFDRSIFARMGELGLTGAPLPEAVGGSGFSYVGWTLVMEELGAADMASAVTLSVHILSQYPVVTWGTAEQHERWLGPMIAGEKLGAFALTEPHAGSDAGSLRTRAERGRRRLVPADRLEDLDLERAGGRPLPRVRDARPVGRPAGDHRVPRREGIARVHVRGPREEDGHPVVPRRGADLRRLRRPGREPPRRGGRRLPDRAVGAGRGPDLDRRGVRRDRPLRARAGRPVPRRAAGVRRAAGRAAGPPVHGRGDGAGRRGGTGADPPGGGGEGSGRADRRGVVAREVDRLRHRDARRDRRRPAVRRRAATRARPASSG